MASRTGTCEVCTQPFDVPGARGRIPKRCRSCAHQRKVDYNRERYQRTPPEIRAGRQRKAPTGPRYKRLACAECEQPFEVLIKPGGLSKSCDQCAHDRRVRQALARRAGVGLEERFARHLWKNYRLTVADYEAMAEAQSRLCALCERPPGGKRRLQVDHCHSTGRVRGLLCVPCNTALGKLQDSPEILRKAADYVERHRPARGQDGS